jgi:hypothetical protein
MIAGFLGLASSVLMVLALVGGSALFFTKLTPATAQRHSPDFAGLDIAPILAQAHAERAQPPMATPVWFLMLPLMAAALQIPSSILMILGGRKMRQLETYGLAVLAAVVALLPTGPAWIISFPIGIWALLVLAGPEVRSAFRAQGRIRSNRCYLPNIPPV